MGAEAQKKKENEGCYGITSCSKCLATMAPPYSGQGEKVACIWCMNEGMTNSRGACYKDGSRTCESTADQVGGVDGEIANCTMLEREIEKKDNTLAHDFEAPDAGMFKHSKESEGARLYADGEMPAEEMEKAAAKIAKYAQSSKKGKSKSTIEMEEQKEEKEEKKEEKKDE